HPLGGPTLAAQFLGLLISYSAHRHRLCTSSLQEISLRGQSPVSCLVEITSHTTTIIYVMWTSLTTIGNCYLQPD
ncbi:21617_t:CDS:1, partial [Rhizophagus irregularis]